MDVYLAITIVAIIAVILILLVYLVLDEQSKSKIDGWITFKFFNNEYYANIPEYPGADNAWSNISKADNAWSNISKADNAWSNISKADNAWVPTDSNMRKHNANNNSNGYVTEGPKSTYIDSMPVYDLIYEIAEYSGSDQFLQNCKEQMDMIAMEYGIGNQKHDIWNMYNNNLQVKAKIDVILKRLGKDVTKTHFVDTDCTANEYIPHVDRWYYDPDIKDIDHWAVEKRWQDIPEGWHDTDHWGTKVNMGLAGVGYFDQYGNIQFPN